jgi:hypothetical protein
MKLPKYKLDDLFANFRYRVPNVDDEKKAEEAKAERETRMKRMRQRFTAVTEDEVDYADELPHLYDMLSYVRKRMTAKTGAERAALMEKFSNLSISGNDFDDLSMRVKEAESELAECGVAVDPVLTLTVLTRNLPAHARPVVAHLSVLDADTDTIIDTLSAHFRSEAALNCGGTQPTLQAAPGGQESAVEGAHALQYTSYPARGRRGGRGGRGGRWGRGRGKCHNCGRIGHYAYNCRLTKSHDASPQSDPAPAQHTPAQREKKQITCWYCHKIGHKEEECRKK